MSRARNRILSAVALFVALAPTPLITMAERRFNGTQTIKATPIPDIAGKERSIGALTYIEGWVIDSDYTAFGGFSGMALLGERQFLLVSDTGIVARFTLTRNGTVQHASIKPIPEGPGSADNKLARDMESLVASPDGDIFWIGFERVNAVWKYSAQNERALANARPKAMQNWKDNRGPESMTRLKDGRFLILSENEDDDPRGKRALLFAGDPTVVPDSAIPFFYDSGNKGLPTDVQQLPDGRILILHRDVSLLNGFTTTLAIADIDGIAKDKVLTSKTIATIARPNITENFEGMTIRQEGDDLMLWTVSDDNLMGFQRTLLIKYRIDPAKLQARSE